MSATDVNYVGLTGWTKIKVRCHICQSFLVANDSTDIKCPSCDLHANAEVTPSNNSNSHKHSYASSTDTNRRMDPNLSTPVVSPPIRRVEFADVDSNQRNSSTYNDSAQKRKSSRSPVHSETKVDLQTVSKKLNEKMRDGWTMLKTTCPSTQCNGTPLIRSPGGAVTICVHCDGSDSSYKNTPIGTPTKTTSPYSEDDLNSRISRKIRLGWTLIDQVCNEPECIGNVPLMKDLNGQIRCVQCYYFVKVPTPVSVSPNKRNNTSPSKASSSSNINTSASNAEEERVKRTAAIKRAGDMLLSGWKLLSASCPICFSALLSKNNVMRCPSCDLPVMDEDPSSSSNASSSPTSKSTSVMSAIAAESSSSSSSNTNNTRFEYVAESKSTFYESLEEEKKKYDTMNKNMAHVSKRIGEKLLTGWTMLSTSCPRAGCQGTPLMDSPSGDVKMLCVACEQCYEYDRYGVLLNTNNDHESATKHAKEAAKPISSPSAGLRGTTSVYTVDAGTTTDNNSYYLNMNNAPVLSPYRDSASYSSAMGDYSHDATVSGDGYAETTTFPSNVVRQRSSSSSRRSNDEDSSNKLSKKLLQGWAMLDRVCTADGCTGNVPLMRDLTGKVRCVECDFDATVDKSSPVKVRTVPPTVTTPFSSPTPVVSSPLGTDIVSKISRKVSLGWTVQDNYCKAPECEGNVPLMIDLNGNVRCVQCLNYQTKHALSPALADIYAEKQARVDNVAAFENPLSAQHVKRSLESNTSSYESYDYNNTSSYHNSTMSSPVVATIPVTPSKVTFSPSPTGAAMINTETYSVDSRSYSSSQKSSYFDVYGTATKLDHREDGLPNIENMGISTPSVDTNTPQLFYTAQSPEKEYDNHSHHIDDNDPTTPTIGERTPSEFHTVYTLDRSMMFSAPPAKLPPPPPPPRRPIYDEIDVSKKMYDKMFAGWIMMNTNCRNQECKGTSLMQSTSKQAELVCVCCDTIYKLDDNNNIITIDDPSIRNTTSEYDQTSNATLVNSFPASSLEYIPYIPEAKSLSSYQDILDKYASTTTSTTTSSSTSSSSSSSNSSSSSEVVTHSYAGSYQEILDKYSPITRNNNNNTTDNYDQFLSSPNHLSTPSSTSIHRSHHTSLEAHLTTTTTTSSTNATPSNATGYQDVLDVYLPRIAYGDTREALSVLKAAKGSEGILSALKLKLKNVCNELEGCLNVDEALKLTDLMIKLEQAIGMLDGTHK